MKVTGAWHLNLLGNIAVNVLTNAKSAVLQNVKQYCSCANISLVFSLKAITNEPLELGI
jgi:hypothetical protein